MRPVSKISATLLFLLFTFPIYPQIGGIEDSVNNISDTIRTIFHIISGVIFLIGLREKFWGPPDRLDSVK